MKYSLVLLFLLLTSSVFSQDTICFKDNHLQIANIEAVNSTEIRYHLFGEVNGPIYIINTEEISKIVFKSGLVQFFDAPASSAPKGPSLWSRVFLFKNEGNLNDDVYRPFANDKKYSRTAAKFGYYFSTGIGVAGCHKQSGFAQLASFSFAYKTHLLSISGGHFTNSWDEPVAGYNYCSGSYFGVLLGESLRLKWLLLSASVGVGSTSLDFYKYPFPPYSPYPQNSFNVSSKISMPIEFKLFYTAPVNGIGFGIHVCENVLSLSQHAALSSYSSLYFGVSLVTGFWNNVKH